MKFHGGLMVLLLLAGCARSALESDRQLTDSGVEAERCGSAPAGDCNSAVACSATPNQGCVVAFDHSMSTCLGHAGARCESGCDCVTGVCAPPIEVDCFAKACSGQPPVCSLSQLGGPCLADGDCAYGTCGHLPVSAPHTLGSCCGGVGQQCGADGDCCSGLTCATDNTGCRVGPTPTCTIDGVVVAKGALNPTNDCQVCDPDADPMHWNSLGAVGEYHPPCGPGPHPGGTGPGINYCCSGACADSCSQ